MSEKRVSEFDIAEQNGLDPVPERTQPAPEDSIAASRRFQSAASKYNRLYIRIRTYLGQSYPEAQLKIIELIDEARAMAIEVRECAAALADFESFYRMDSGILYYSQVAAAADEAYDTRVQALDELETEFATTTHARTPIVPGSLVSHEQFEGGHLITKHVGLTMEDFKNRFLNEGSESYRPL